MSATQLHPQSAPGVAAREDTRRSRPRSSRRRVADAATYAWLTVAAIVVCFPLYYIFVGAVTPTEKLVRGLSGLVPTKLTLENLRNATSVVPLGHQFVNSTFVTVAQTSGQVAISVISAYALVFCRLRRPKLVFVVILSTMMIPAETVIVANYLTISSWHLRDTLPAIFLPFLASAFEIFLLRQAFLAFPMALREAAVLDGSGHFRFIGTVLLPLTRPALVSVTLISAINAWNGFFWPLLVTTSNNSRTAQIGIAQLTNSEDSKLGVTLAGAALVTTPILILVVIGQRFLVRGLTAGAIR